MPRGYRPEGTELSVALTKTKEAAERKALALIRKGYRAEIRPVGRGTGAWAGGWRWITEWYTSWRERR